MPRIYVAGGSSERLTVVRPHLLAIQAAGWTVTHDWTVAEGYDGPVTPAVALSAATADLEGVRAADLVWFLVPEDKSEGMGFELGAATVLGKRTVVSGPWAGRCVFHTMASYRFGTHESAATWLAAAVRR